MGRWYRGAWSFCSQWMPYWKAAKLFKPVSLNYTRPQRWRWRWRICLQRPGNRCALAAMSAMCRPYVQSFGIQMLHQTCEGEEGSWCLVTIFWWGVTWGEEWPWLFAFPSDKRWDTVFEDIWYLSSMCECIFINTVPNVMYVCFPSYFTYLYTIEGKATRGTWQQDIMLSTISLAGLCEVPWLIEALRAPSRIAMGMTWSMWENQLGWEVWELRRVLACQEPGELQALEKEASLLGIDRRRSPRSNQRKESWATPARPSGLWLH